MNKNLILISSGVLILVLGAVGFFFLRLRGGQNASQPQSSAVDNTKLDQEILDSTPATTSGNLLDLLKLGKDYVCDVNYVDDFQTTTSGKIYIASSGNKMNGEFKMVQADGTTSTSNVISDGEYSYVWSSEFPQGFKTMLLDEGVIPDGDTEDVDESEVFKGTGLAESVDFDCNDWDVDESMFVPPSDIDFLDTSEVTDASVDASGIDSEPTPPTPPVDACAACAQSPDEATREQCEQALGC